VDTDAGGFEVPKRTSKLVAPLAVQVSVGDVATPVAWFEGDGAVGVDGGPGGEGLATIVESLVLIPGAAVR
jgi:hypothetical protein